MKERKRSEGEEEWKEEDDKKEGGEGRWSYEKHSKQGMKVME
jgi:hypothetical protein